MTERVIRLSDAECVAATIIADACLHDPTGTSTPTDWLGHEMTVDVHHDADGRRWTRYTITVTAEVVALADEHIAATDTEADSFAAWRAALVRDE
jgi:hypothetical protein